MPTRPRPARLSQPARATRDRQGPQKASASPAQLAHTKAWRAIVPATGALRTLHLQSEAPRSQSVHVLQDTRAQMEVPACLAFREPSSSSLGTQPVQIASRARSKTLPARGCVQRALLDPPRPRAATLQALAGATQGLLVKTARMSPRALLARWARIRMGLESVFRATRRFVALDSLGSSASSQQDFSTPRA